MRCVSTAVAQLSTRLIHSMNWMAHYGDPCRTSRTLPDVQCEVTVTFSNRLVYNLKHEQFKSVRFYHVVLNAYRSTVLHDNITGILWEEQRRE